jgi:hypothetical protein
VYSSKYIITIPMDSILPIYDDLKNESNISMTKNKNSENKLFLLANCFWSEDESRAKMYAKYLFKNGSLHED